MTGAGEESRTLDLNLGKVALYQLSYSREASDSSAYRLARRERVDAPWTAQRVRRVDSQSFCIHTARPINTL